VNCLATVPRWRRMNGTQVVRAQAAPKPYEILWDNLRPSPLVNACLSALAWAGFYKPRMMMSPNTATKDDPLAQKRTIGYKFFGKAVIKDQTRLLRLEVADA
jgi:hypothetical protein